MSIQLRNYHHPQDYWRVDRFLINHYQPGNAEWNWIEPAWEYMHFHPALNSALLDKIGIWEESGKMVGVAHFEDGLGDAFFQFHPSYRFLRDNMLDYAEHHLAGQMEENGRKFLRAYVSDNDGEFQALVQERGYQKDSRRSRPMYSFDVPDPFPAIHLPEGFRLTSLAEECDWAKVHQVMWRGFNHGDEVPMNEEEFESRRMMFDTPTARRDLKVAVGSPDGDFVAFCGMFYEPTHRYAYVEPVATDPRYRRMGLGKAAVLEGIRRSALLGATVAYVGSDQAFYQAIGFKPVFTSECWVKFF